MPAKKSQPISILLIPCSLTDAQLASRLDRAVNSWPHDLQPGPSRRKQASRRRWINAMLEQAGGLLSDQSAEDKVTFLTSIAALMVELQAPTRPRELVHASSLAEASLGARGDPKVQVRALIQRMEASIAYQDLSKIAVVVLERFQCLANSVPRR